jgi:hypothetical protein
MKTAYQEAAVKRRQRSVMGFGPSFFMWNSAEPRFQPVIFPLFLVEHLVLFQYFP